MAIVVFHLLYIAAVALSHWAIHNQVPQKINIPVAVGQIFVIALFGILTFYITWVVKPDTSLASKEISTLQELSISNMWEIAALVEVLEQKGILTKEDIYTAIRELRKKNPSAKLPSQLEGPPPETKPTKRHLDGDKLVERILEVILDAGLSSKQGKELLDRTKAAIE